MERFYVESGFYQVNSSGAWVRYEDARKRIEALEADVAAAHREHDEWLGHCHDLIEIVDRLLLAPIFSDIPEHRSDVRQLVGDARVLVHNPLVSPQLRPRWVETAKAKKGGS